MVDALDSEWEKTVKRDLAVGRTVGEYVILRRIGEGGMGIVYEAEHPQIGRRVAIKIIRRDVELTRDLLVEARAVSLIRHRHIIDVFGFGELEGLGQYLVMDLLEGNPLDEELRARAPLGPTEVMLILDDTCAALSAAHAKNVIHRDLKPGNLFVVRESNGTRYVKVLDFGLARPPPASVPPERRTREGTAMGTPEYMSPEQAQAKPVDGRTDLYALGVIAFEMLTGRLPFTGEGPLEIAMKQVTDAPPRPSSLVPSVPAQLEALVLQLLAKNPDDRPPSADAVRGELKRIRRDLSAEPTPIGRALPPELFDAPPTDAGQPEPSTVEPATLEAAAVRVPDTEPSALPELPALAALPRRRSPALPLALGGAALLLVAIGALIAAQPREQTVVAPPPVQPTKPPPTPEPEPVQAPPREPPPADEPLEEQPKTSKRPPVRRTGQLQVFSRGCTVEVFIDGRSVGHTPMVPPQTLPAGDHVVRMVNPLCTPVVQERVRLAPGAALKFDRQFEKK